jgi:response regulator of citrate/malate metabolism
MFSVLVVEDNDLIARQLARCVSENRWLKLAGVAATEQDAIAKARRVCPDLVLLDFGLSTPLAGFDVWHAMHTLEKVPKVIAVTAAGDMSTVQKAQDHGAFDYVVKPFTSATIHAKLADYVDNRRRQLAVPPHVSQATIDWVFSLRRRSPVLPAGLERKTLESIVGALRAAATPLRVSEVADQVSVARETANRYLLYLHEQSIAARVREHGRPGPPPYLYTLAPLWNPAPEDPATS